MSAKSEMFIEWIEEWSQFLGGCNWYTFHFCQIEFEDDRMMGAVEATFVIMGLGFRWRWNFRETETTQELQRRMEGVKEMLDD